ncbi:MAG: DUF1016 N-terminal domain-containing protein [Ginsengibacter sp.]
MKRVNKALIKLYWELGKNIVEKQQKYKWGKSVVEKLAEDLQKGACSYSWIFFP